MEWSWSKEILCLGRRYNAEGIMQKTTIHQHHQHIDHDDGWDILCASSCWTRATQMDDTNLDRIDDTGNGSDGEMCQSHRLHLHSGEASRCTSQQSMAESDCAGRWKSRSCINSWPWWWITIMAVRCVLELINLERIVRHITHSCA